jgi:hypothetical protein
MVSLLFRLCLLRFRLQFLLRPHSLSLYRLQHLPLPKKNPPPHLPQVAVALLHLHRLHYPLLLYHSLTPLPYLLTTIRTTCFTQNTEASSA